MKLQQFLMLDFFPIRGCPKKDIAINTYTVYKASCNIFHNIDLLLIKSDTN